MKAIYIFLISLGCFSCADKNKEMEQMNQRIIRLEQKVDALTGNGDSIKLDNISSPIPYNIQSTNGRCQGLTKKRTQCKRKAKSGNYCWQHSS